MKRLYLLLFVLSSGLFVIAQGDGGGADININIKEGGDSSAGFFANPIVWVIGAVIFILLLVVLLRRPRN